MIVPAPAPRMVCPRCLRPQRMCICKWVNPVAHAVEVLILQHPLESAQAKGSARLLHLSLPHSRLAVGEAFGQQELAALLREPFGPLDTSSGMPPHRHPILLYPDTPAGNDIAQPAAISTVPLDDLGRLRLVVLDATWRKSRKMLYANPLLQTLPRLALREVPASRYLIRKAHGAHQLSTLEATCYALMQLEQDDAKYQPLLTAFDGFVAQQLAWRAPSAADAQNC